MIKSNTVSDDDDESQLIQSGDTVLFGLTWKSKKELDDFDR